MPNYYVRPDGSNANAGTGPAVNQAWQTVQYALSNATLGTGVNIIYIAPGIYRETVTINITPSSTNTLVIEGDPTCQQFTGVTPGIVRLTNLATDTGAFSAASAITGVSKTYTTIKKLCVEGTITFSGSSNNLTITQCQLVVMPAGAQTWLDMTLNGNATISNCIQHCLVTTSGGTAGGNNFTLTNNAQLSFFDNVVMSMFGNGVAILSATTGCNANIYNCTFAGYFNFGIYARPTSTGCVTVRNCIIAGRGANAALDSSPGGGIVEDYNRILYTGTLRNGPSAGANTTTTGALGLDYGGAYLVGLSPQPFLGRMATSPNAGFGASSGAPAADLYGVTWTNATPDAGAITYSPINTVGPYIPAERNASTITIAPGSTSQSIELYLGATGLTASTAGLSARYNRTRTASVDIPLVARTIAQAWTSGGFAEVDATNMPGVYRLDIPDAALAAGADDVTVVVRGASGTNGAVMTVKLSSGGLTAAQTASAVWDEARSSHVTAGTFGEYVNAELVTPVTSAALVRMGPFEVKADGLGASDPLDIQKGAQHGVDIQCVDGNGNGIDITSATVTAKVYNSGASLVDTYACTATYAADGRATFTIDTTVTNTPGTYTATITRTTGASDTQVFGPLRIYVRDI